MLYAGQHLASPSITTIDDESKVLLDESSLDLLRLEDRARSGMKCNLGLLKGSLDQLYDKISQNKNSSMRHGSDGSPSFTRTQLLAEESELLGFLPLGYAKKFPQQVR